MKIIIAAIAALAFVSVARGQEAPSSSLQDRMRADSRHDGFKQCVSTPNISNKEFRACQQRWLPPPAVPFDPDAPYQSVDPAPKAHVDPEWEEFKNLVIGLLLLFGEYIVLPFGLLIWACWHLGSLFNGLSDIHASNVARHTADEFERRRRKLDKRDM